MRKRLLSITFIGATLFGWSPLSAQTAPSLIENNAYVEFSGPNSDYTNGITVEAWVNFEIDNTTLWMGQSAANVGGTTTDVWLWHNNQLFVNNAGTWVAVNLPAYPSCWTHVAFTADALGIKVYYNGNLVLTDVTPVTSIINNPTSAIHLGKDPRFPAGTPGRYSNIPIDEFAVWNTVRTPTEISSSYLNSLKGNEAGLIQYTKFEEGAGIGCKSLTGVAGTLINTTAWTDGDIPANEFYNIDFQGLGGMNERYAAGVSGDFDGDGDIDIVCQDEVLNWRLFTNDGAGNFTSAVIASGLYSAMKEGDIDGDNDLDLIAGNGRVYKNDGAGVFTLFDDLMLALGKPELGDVDGDNDLDAIFGNTGTTDSLMGVSKI